MDFSNLTTSEAGALGGILGFAVGVIIFIALISLVISVLYIIGTWKMYKKAEDMVGLQSSQDIIYMS